MEWSFEWDAGTNKNELFACRFSKRMERKKRDSIEMVAAVQVNKNKFYFNEKLSSLCERVNEKILCITVLMVRLFRLLTACIVHIHRHAYPPSSNVSHSLNYCK